MEVDRKGEKKMLARAPKGTNDILPSQIDYWYYVENRIKKILQNYGYRELRTPAFEYTELFIRGIGETTDIVNKEMFTFNDRKGRSLTLRPEGTAPVVRAFLEHKMSSDQYICKLFYLGSMFRCEKPQAGRFRQFNQFGLEAIGIQEAIIDAEVISASLKVYQELGLRNLDLMLNSVGCGLCRPGYLKVLREYFKERKENLCPDCRERYDKNPLRILDCKNEQCQFEIKGSPSILDYLCDECRNHFHSLGHYLEGLGIKYQINPLLVRGLDYYTKTAFEIISHELGSQNAIGGGGRYDYLVEELGGKPTPAVGFAAGIERIIATMEKQEINIPLWKGIEIFVAHAEEEDIPYTVKITFLLREKGITAEMAYIKKSLKAQMRLANKMNVSFVIIVGQKELKDQQILVKNMQNSKQELVHLDKIVPYLQSALKI